MTVPPSATSTSIRRVDEQVIAVISRVTSNLERLRGHAARIRGSSLYTVAIMIADREYNERDQRDVGRGHVPVLAACERHGTSLEGSFRRALRRRTDRFLRSRPCDLQNARLTESQNSTIRFQVRSREEGTNRSVQLISLEKRLLILPLPPPTYRNPFHSSYHEILTDILLAVLSKKQTRLILS